MKPVRNESELGRGSVREYVEAALRETGMTEEEMAERLGYKSLRRAMSGEIPLPDAKRRHIQDLVLLARYAKGNGSLNLGGTGETKARSVPLLSRAHLTKDFPTSTSSPAGESCVVTDCPDSQAFAFTVEGDSMEPHFRAGDAVVVTPLVRPKNESLVLVVLQDGDVLFKRLAYQDAKGDQMMLLSYNPVYPPREVHADQVRSFFGAYSVMRYLSSP